MSILYQNSLKGFLHETVKQGEIHLLVSGTLGGLATWDYQTGQWTWDTGSWMHLPNNSVDSQGEWITSGSRIANTGSFQPRTYLKGLAVSAYAFGSNKKELNALEVCNRLKMEVELGESGQKQNLDLKIKSKQLRNGYVFLEVDDVLLPAGSTPVDTNVYFKYNGSEYRGYTCYTGSSITILNLYPYVAPVESEEYNPVYNNVVSNVEGTIARLVESFNLTNVYVAPKDYNLYDGWYAPWNSFASASEDPLGYEQWLFGSSSVGSRPTSGGVVVDTGGAAGIYYLVPSMTVEKATEWACIPDSFYSSIANISGRWLGTKNAEYHIYLGDKLEFTAKNINECRESIQQNAGNLVYQNSPFVVQVSINQEPVTLTNLSGSIQGIFEQGTLIGTLDGTFNGVLSGYVTDINVQQQDIEYYSSSVNIINHQVLMNTSSVVRASGQGTLLLEHSRIETNGSVSESYLIDSLFTGSGLREVSGLWTFGTRMQGVPAEFLCQMQNVSGDIKTWGYLEGSGEINYPGIIQQNTTASTLQLSQVVASNTQQSVAQFEGELLSTRQFTNSNCLYLKNAQLHGEGLTISNIESGLLQVDPRNRVYVSGTVGNAAENFSLHTFDGTVDLLNNVPLHVSFNYADNDGVVLSNIETAEETTTVFDSFNTDGIVIADGFGIKVGLVLQSGRVSFNSAGNTYVSLVTEDQQEIAGSGSGATGSLPGEGISEFMANYDTQSSNPNWNIAQIKEVLLDTGPFFPEGVALISGSFKDFEVQGTRRTLKFSRYTRNSGSIIPQSDTLQAVRLLADLEAGLEFAELAKSRIEANIEASNVTPRIVSVARLPQKVYDAVQVANNYTVDGGEPIWNGTVLPQDFNFYNDSALESVQGYINTSEDAIGRLSGYLSGSLLDTINWHQQGQYTYVYLDSAGTTFIQANLRDFSGSYVTFAGDFGTCNCTPISGSFQRLWGRFGTGLITEEITEGAYQREANLVRTDWPVTVGFGKATVGTISGVVYGAFDFSGYLNGGYEGSAIEGTVEGVMAGNFAGIVNTGSVEGGPVRLSGINMGSFNGTIKAGSLEGVLKNLEIAGNNLTDNVIFKGSLTSVEEFPLEGRLSGSVLSITLPGQCKYSITASSENYGQFDLHIPSEGNLTGRLGVSSSFEFLPRSGSLGKTTILDLAGDNIDVLSKIAGRVSGSFNFKPEGKLQLAAFESTIPTSSYSDVQDFVDSKISGQFKLEGNLNLTTSGSPFSGEISPVLVDQAIKGEFNCKVEDTSQLDLQTITGSLFEFRGEMLARGLVSIGSGIEGNLVEGTDRPFFTLQTFSGGVFPEDTTLEAIQNMNMSDMVMENLGFTSGMALLQYSTGSFGKIKEQEYVQNTLTLPQVGDIIYTDLGGRTRVVSSKIYCPDLNAVLIINDRGTVVSEHYLTQVQ